MLGVRRWTGIPQAERGISTLNLGLCGCTGAPFSDSLELSAPVVQLRP